MKRRWILACTMALLTAIVGCGGGDLAQSSTSSSTQSFTSSSSSISQSSSAENSSSMGAGTDSSSDSSSTVQEFKLIYELANTRDRYSVVGYKGEATDVVIPDTYMGLPVWEIREKVFYDCQTMTSIVIGANVEYILNYAFALCYSLESVTLGEKVHHIGMRAFLYCEALREIVIPASVNYIENNAFDECIRLKSVVFEDKLGWKTVSGKRFSESELENPKDAAKLITDTYLKTTWRKEEN